MIWLPWIIAVACVGACVVRGVQAMRLAIKIKEQTNGKT